MKEKNMRIVLIGCVIIVMLAVGVGLFCLNKSFGPAGGRVFSASNLDSDGKSILKKCLRIDPPKEIEFKHVSMIGGKDWTLYVCVELAAADWEGFLKSVAFATRPQQGRELPVKVQGIAWWRIEKDKVDTVLYSTEGFTALIALTDGDNRRVFIYTDGGPLGFPQSIWQLFQNQR